MINANELEDAWTSAEDVLANPTAVNASIDAVLNSTNTSFPHMDLPEDDLVNLPGGLKTKNGVYKTAQVRELTGEDEEALARAAQSTNPFHFVNTLLERGTVKIGDASPRETKKLLSDMLIGDRDALLLGIRRVTYGNNIEFEGWKCPQCGKATDLDITLDDIPMEKLESVDDVEFEVKLWKGGTARVRLPSGYDQKKVFEDPNNSDAERDSVLLAQAVLEMTGPDGDFRNVSARADYVREMGVKDRKAILKEIVKRQPGPRYDEVKFDHQDCGEEVSLTVTVGDLFLDLL